MATREEIKREKARLAYRRKRIKRRKRIVFILRVGILAFFVFLLFGIGMGAKTIALKLFQKDADIISTESDIEGNEIQSEKDNIQKIVERPELDVQLLTPNEYSRPGMALEKVKGIVVHYTGNPGTSAIQNRNYFESLKDLKKTKASSHFIIGIKGEIVQCIPSTEMSYASKERNVDTISIECCHEDAGGKFSEATYDSLVELTAWLCGNFNLTTDDIIRHYDVTEKECPKYYVENEDEWVKFKEDVGKYIAKNAVEKRDDD